MINGLSRSNAFQVANTKYNHLKKMAQILSAKSTITDGFQQEQALSQSRRRHELSSSVRSLSETSRIKNENRKMVMSMAKIACRPQLFPLSKTPIKRGNYSYVEQKNKLAIRKQNADMFKRLLEQKSSYSKKKTNQEFKKSRCLVKRIEKFNFFINYNKSLPFREKLMSEMAPNIVWAEAKNKLSTLLTEPNPQCSSQL